MDLLACVAGVALLTVGGEALIRGAMAAARRLGVSPLLSGLVIVGFGTSTPELVVSLDAARNAQPDIALGNVLGSNIGNILLILGICALITPLTVTASALRRDALTMVAASVLFLVLAAGTTLDRRDGALFLAGLGVYLLWAYRSERRGGDPAAELHRAEADELQRVPESSLRTVASVVVGLALLIGGARLLLIGVVGIARDLGVSEAVIGLTVVAVGTSLPELSISLLAAIRRHADVAVGNVIGSNIFNILGILGLSALLQPLPLPARMVSFDQWVLLGSALMLVLLLLSGRRLNRLEGGALLAGYVVYLGFTLA